MKVSKIHTLKAILALVLSLSLALAFTGCSSIKKGSSGKTGDLSQDFSASIVRPQKEQTKNRSAFHHHFGVYERF